MPNSRSAPVAASANIRQTIDGDRERAEHRGDAAARQTAEVEPAAAPRQRSASPASPAAAISEPRRRSGSRVTSSPSESQPSDARCRIHSAPDTSRRNRKMNRASAGDPGDDLALSKS